MKTFLFVLSILFTVYGQVECGRQKVSTYICRRDEINDIAQQLNRFSDIPEIGYNSMQFAPMISALYKDAVRRQNSHHHSFRKRPQCIVDFFDRADNISKLNAANDHYADRKENILTQAMDEARRILSDVQPVYDAMKAYELLEYSSNYNVIDKCRQHDPHTILALFEHLVLQHPTTLFQRIAKGVQYDMLEFYGIALQLVNRLSVCAVLTKACDALRGEKSVKEQQHYQNITARRLKSIYDVLEQQVKVLQSEFNEQQIQQDVQVALVSALKPKFGWKDLADTVRERLSRKYYHHHWIVMAFEKENLNLHLDFADRRTFLVGIDEYSFIVHAAAADGRCSQFARIFGNRTKLRSLYDNDDLFTNTLTEDENLILCVSNLKELLQRYNLPADYFIGVISYRPNHAVSYDPVAASHHVEHLRNPKTGKLSKSVIISWC